jgi:hypothetical protein
LAGGSRQPPRAGDIGTVPATHLGLVADDQNIRWLYDPTRNIENAYVLSMKKLSCSKSGSTHARLLNKTVRSPLPDLATSTPSRREQRMVRQSPVQATDRRGAISISDEPTSFKSLTGFESPLTPADLTRRRSLIA